MRCAAVVLGLFAVWGFVGCGDQDPVSSLPDEGAMPPTGKLAVSATKAGGYRGRRPQPPVLVIDQQQPTVNGAIGALGIGGASEQKLAQVVTAGVTGTLVQVRLPVAGSSGELLVEVQGVSAGLPNGVVLTSEVFSSADLPSFAPDPPTHRSLSFSTPVFFSSGDRFALVLSSSGEFGLFQGPAGNSYPGGEGFFDARPNPAGVWVPVSFSPRDASDWPFQTVVNPK